MTGRIYITDDGRFCHPCQAPGCRKQGGFGYGCNLLAHPPRLGMWWCGEHRAQGQQWNAACTAKDNERLFGITAKTTPTTTNNQQASLAL